MFDPKVLRSPYAVKHLPAGFTSKVFDVENIKLADKSEQIVKGGRHLFNKLPQAFDGIKKIAVVGYGPQGGAQAQNLRDSLEGTGIKTVVGLRETSSSREEARDDGFTELNGSLTRVEDAVKDADLVLGLIADSAMVHEHERLLYKNMKPSATLGLSHGFLLGHLQSKGLQFPGHMDVIAVCPKGVGASVRRLYEQGKTCNGAGINASFAVHQAKDVQRATDLALGWSVALGSPFTFQTTLESEYKSDIFGERGILIGGVHAITEALFRHFVETRGMGKEEAYLKTVETITGPISSTLSKKGGFQGVIEQIRAQGDEEEFARAYEASYGPSMDVLYEIYDSVASGQEIASVVDHGRRLKAFSMKSMAETPLWKTAETVRAKSHSPTLTLDPTVTGMYLAMMVAQCDLLDANGHCYSEIANESIIEAIDSLNPYMAFKGVDYLVDNCSTTARLGSRKWAPRFDYLLTQQAIPKIANKTTALPIASLVYQAFLDHKIHAILAKCCELRPSVDIAPKETFLEKGAKTSTIN